jgi:hypothetical protein
VLKTLTYKEKEYVVTDDVVIGDVVIIHDFTEEQITFDEPMQLFRITSFEDPETTIIYNAISGHSHDTRRGKN